MTEIIAEYTAAVRADKLRHIIKFAVGVSGVELTCAQSIGDRKNRRVGVLGPQRIDQRMSNRRVRRVERSCVARCGVADRVRDPRNRNEHDRVRVGGKGVIDPIHITGERRIIRVISHPKKVNIAFVELGLNDSPLSVLEPQALR